MLDKAKSEFKRMSTAAYAEIGMPSPTEPEPYSREQLETYFRTNYDLTAEVLEKAVTDALREQQPIHHTQIFDETDTHLKRILLERIRAAAKAVADFEPNFNFETILFGTLPGGGLSAFTQKVGGSNDFLIVLPGGLFDMVNLNTKLIIQLQPLHGSGGDAVFLPSASFEQLTLANDPLICFRATDSWRNYFLYGDSRGALPYKKALPYQDRYAYILVGTEMFVIFHEIAHILSGHLEQDHQWSLADEYQADQVALELMKIYFKQEVTLKGPFSNPEERAMTCNFLFLHLNKYWETVIKKGAAVHGLYPQFATHPSAEERFRNFDHVISKFSSAKTALPTWLMLTYTGINLLFNIILKETSDEIMTLSNGLDDFHKKVLPMELIHCGVISQINEYHWAMTVAELILGNDPEKRILGLKLMYDDDYIIYSTYKGILEEEEEISDLFKACLCAIQPIYKTYMPTLIQKFINFDNENTLGAYISQISFSFRMAISSKLNGEEDE
jgi:hypothetical protein